MDRNQKQDSCSHQGYHTGLGRYSQDSKTLRYVLICDECGEEMKEISKQEYVPDPVFDAA
jgi:hypothetical protein